MGRTLTERRRGSSICFSLRSSLLESLTFLLLNDSDLQIFEVEDLAQREGLLLDSIPTHSLHQRRKVLIQAGEGAVLALVNSAVIGSLTSLKGVSRGGSCSCYSFISCYWNAFFNQVVSLLRERLPQVEFRSSISFRGQERQKRLLLLQNTLLQIAME